MAVPKKFPNAVWRSTFIDGHFSFFGHARVRPFVRFFRYTTNRPSARRGLKTRTKNLGLLAVGHLATGRTAAPVLSTCGLLPSSLHPTRFELLAPLEDEFLFIVASRVCANRLSICRRLNRVYTASCVLPPMQLYCGILDKCSFARMGLGFNHRL